MRKPMTTIGLNLNIGRPHPPFVYLFPHWGEGFNAPALGLARAVIRISLETENSHSEIGQ